MCIPSFYSLATVAGFLDPNVTPARLARFQIVLYGILKLRAASGTLMWLCFTEYRAVCMSSSVYVLDLGVLDLVLEFPPLSTNSHWEEMLCVSRSDTLGSGNSTESMESVRSVGYHLSSLSLMHPQPTIFEMLTAEKDYKAFGVTFFCTTKMHCECNCGSMN